MQTTIIFTPWFYLQCFLGGMLGMLFQIIARLRSLKESARVANVPFDTWQAFKEDWLSHVASLLALLIYLFCLTTFVIYRPNIAPFIKAISVVAGAFGSFALGQAFGVVKKRIMTVIDQKTNIADAVTGDPDKKD